jgi:replication factor A1
MPNLDEIISRMIKSRPGLNRQDLLRAISEKKREIGSRFLSDEGAAYIIASELNLDLNEHDTSSSGLSIRDLVPGLSDVTLSGRITEIHQPQSFQKGSGSTGKVRRMAISDSTGTAGVVLWDEKADVVELRGVSVNDHVKIVHGYVREGPQGKSEIHVGDKGDVLRAGQPTSQIEDFSSFTQISQLNTRNPIVDIQGTISRILGVHKFKRSDGSEGLVLRARIADNSGSATVVAWDERATEMAALSKGSYVDIKNARVKQGIRGGLEVHINRSGEVRSKLSPPPGFVTGAPGRTKISSIKPGDIDLTVIARLAAKGPVVDFQRRGGEVGRVANAIIRDETGSIRLSLWDDKVDILSDLSVGDLLLIEGAYAKENRGRTALSLGKLGEITRSPRDVGAEIPQIEDEPVKISELKPEMNDATILGRVMENPVMKDVVTSRGPTEVTRVRIKDATGEVDVSFWGRLAKEAENLKVGDSIMLRHLYARMTHQRSLELSSSAFTTIERVAKQLDANIAPRSSEEQIGLSEAHEGNLQGDTAREGLNF